MAFTGNKASLVQLSNDLFLDQSTGRYWRGTSFENAQDAGTSDPRSAPAPAAAPAPTPSPSPAPDWFTANAPPTAAPPPAAASGNLQEALAYIKGKIGRDLTAGEQQEAFARFGGNAQSTFTEAGLAPVVEYFKGKAAPAGPAAPPPTNYGSPTTPPDVYTSNPNAPRYNPLPTPTNLAAPYVAPTFNGPAYVDPAKPAVISQPFVLPTQAELEATPGYESRRLAGQRGIESSAAAQGSVLSGGTLKRLDRYNQDYASNEYNNLVGQKLSERGQNVSEYTGDALRAYQAYNSRYGQFLDSANIGLGARQQNAGEFATAQGTNQATYQNRYGAYQDENARTLGDYQTNVNNRRNFNNDFWAQLRDLYNGGANAANNSYRPPV